MFTQENFPPNVLKHFEAIERNPAIKVIVQNAEGIQSSPLVSFTPNRIYATVIKTKEGKLILKTIDAHDENRELIWRIDYRAFGKCDSYLRIFVDGNSTKPFHIPLELSFLISKAEEEIKKHNENTL
ncbi:MAG: hypothetical protein LBC44_05095 [Mycoplasmataceae bacterium]|jgi:hypothetical protein|nr:hypothetical protein [Mycoplasmataceae bacterium]